MALSARALLTIGSALLSKKRSWLAIGLALVLGSQFGGAIGIPATALPDLGIDRFWKEPRDVLVDRIEDARDTQQDTVEQFQTAMEEFKSVSGFDGGNLEKLYSRLNGTFEDSEAAAQKITNRVDRVVSATNRLLEEWRDELDSYHDESIRKKAELQFDETRAKAEHLIQTMRDAADKSQPILNAFRDQVLYLKHNLNMQALTAIDAQTAEIEQDVTSLITEMEASIAEANSFIEQMTVL